jgi:2,4-dienoyl-CoA reductase-like NADH-dependent reductase (Old Yellow Enzyme family)
VNVAERPLPRFPHLLAPVTIRGRVAPNRIMRSATNSTLAEGGRIGERLLAFCDAQAAGVGIFVTEGMRAVPTPYMQANRLSAASDDVIPSCRRLAETIHRRGGLIIGQLGAGGRQHLGRAIPVGLEAPSAIACGHSGGMPHELTIEEIEFIVASFGRAAARLMEAGFDGVEVHGAQGHLTQQFVSPLSNHRTDRYGGSAEARRQFPRELLSTVRGAIGEGAILGYRLGVSEFTEGGLTIDDSTALAAAFAADGYADYYSLSQGNFGTIEAHLPDRHYGQPAFPELHRRIKSASGQVLVAAGGRVQLPEQAEAMIAAGDADIVTFTRALLADSQWALKAAHPQAEPIRRCIGCNQCWGTASDGGPIRCSVNPTAGRESTLTPLQPAAVARRIVVIGAGPAGLEAARVAALRGHRVTVFEREMQPGGKLVRAQLAPHHGELQHVLDFLVPACAAHGVELRLGVEATVESIAAEKPDAVIVATGAAIVVPALPGDGSVPVLAFDGGPLDVPGSGTIVVMDEDGYYWGASAAEAMAATGRHVLLVTRFFEALREVPVTARIPTLRELDNAGADLLANSFVESIDNGAVVLANFRSGRRRRVEGASAVVWTGMQRARDGLAHELRAQGIETHLIGDAMAQRRLMLAIQEAYDVARRL